MDLAFKRLVPKQIMSLRTLQKASYSTRGKSHRFSQQLQGLQELGDPRSAPLTTQGISQLQPHHTPCCPPTCRGLLPLEAHSLISFCPCCCCLDTKSCLTLLRAHGL